MKLPKEFLLSELLSHNVKGNAILNYGVGENATPDSEALKHNQPVGVVRATDRDFEKDHRVDWQRIELTDIYRVFKCEPINTRG